MEVGFTGEEEGAEMMQAGLHSDATLAHLYGDEEDEESVDMNLLHQDDVEDNAVRDDGTRERNLTLWEAAQWQQKVYAIFEGGSFPSDVPLMTERFGMFFALFMFGIIVISSVSVVIESYPQYQDYQPPPIIRLLEVTSVVIFTFDMIVRFFTCPNQLKFLIDPFNWVDLISILPFYIINIGGLTFYSELRAVRVLRLLRLLRVLRSRSVPGLSAMIVAVQTSLDGLVLFIALAAIALLVWSTSAYYAERGTLDTTSGLWYRSCPSYKNCTDPRGEITPFQSIPDSFWWATAAISTVGFGDVEPTSTTGQFVACLAMISGVFILAFPTMILSGNFDAARKFGTIVNYGWTVASSGKKKNEDSPRTQLLKRLGWYDDDLATRQAQQQLAAPTADQQEALAGTLAHGASFGGTLARGASFGGTLARKKRKKKKIGPQPIGCFMFRNIPRYVYRDLDVDEHQYWYDPLLFIADCDDGGPSVRVIWGTCGQPTMVQLTITLDDVDAREKAVALVEGFDPNGRVQCRLGGGVEVRHWANLEHTSAAHWTMQPAAITAAYRNSDFPVYFRWMLEEGELSSYTEDEVAELAITALLGTSLHVNMLAPGPRHLQRLAIVQQVIHHTRLQRDLEMIAMPTEEGGDLMAFVAYDDVCALLHGVSMKVIVDQELTFEEAHQLDRDIVESVLARVRILRVHAVPKHCRSAIYNGDLLSGLANVYEFPMSLFRADEADECEEDALGYADVKLSGYLSRTFRIDIRMDSAPIDGAANEDLPDDGAGADDDGILFNGAAGGGTDFFDSEL